MEYPLPHATSLSFVSSSVHWYFSFSTCPHTLPHNSPSFPSSPPPPSRYPPIPTTPFSRTVLIQEPRQWNQAIQNLYHVLKPGGIICFRDYGRYDMTQLRFKKERLLDDNFYIRGDGTRVYFFEEGANLRRVCLQLPRFLCLFIYLYTPSYPHTFVTAPSSTLHLSHNILVADVNSRRTRKYFLRVHY